jgi:peroxiredoxin Q/BCP
MARTPRVGDTAPDFAARTTAGTDLSLAALRGRWAVLFFFPKAFTAG